MIVVLHNIRSMHNVGAIFRTSDALQIEKIYLCGITPSPVDEFGKIRPQISKVSLGAEENIQWDRCGGKDSLRGKGVYKLLDNLKEDGYKIYVVEQAQNSVPYHKVKLSKKEKDNAVLVLGHEIEGLPDGVLKRGDTALEIPMLGKKKSLNVSVAFGVVAFSLIYS